MNLMKLILVEGQRVTEKVTKGVSQLLIKLVKTKPNNAPPHLPIKTRLLAAPKLVSSFEV